MARTRNIKPGYFSNDLLAECEPLARILFAGLWCIADRAGRLEYRPKKIKADILPYDDCDVSSLIRQLQERKFVQRYTVSGVTYLQVQNFGKHQKPHMKEPESTIPAPDSSGSSTVVAGPSSLTLNPSPIHLNPIPPSEAAFAAPYDPKSEIFGEQLGWLKDRTKRSEGSLRSFLGKCCGEFGDSATLAALIELRAQSPPPVDPLARLRSMLAPRKAETKLSPQGAQYAGFAIAIDRIEQSESDRGEDRNTAGALLDAGRYPRIALAGSG